MKKVFEYIFRHGASHWVRLRIPKDLRCAYPDAQSERLENLHTGDPADAKVRSHAVLARIQAQFKQRRLQLELGRASKAPTRITTLSEEQLKGVADYWAHTVLAQDDARRQQVLEEDEFEALGQQLSAQREELGALLARGKAGAIFPALRSFLYLGGLDFVPDAAEGQRASFTFLRTVVETLDKQLTRQSGGVLDPRAAAPGAEHPLVGNVWRISSSVSTQRWKCCKRTSLLFRRPHRSGFSMHGNDSAARDQFSLPVVDPHIARSQLAAELDHGAVDEQLSVDSRAMKIGTQVHGDETSVSLGENRDGSSHIDQARHYSSVQGAKRRVAHEFHPAFQTQLHSPSVH